MTVARGCCQRLRSIYRQRTAAAGMRITQDVSATLHTCPIPEATRLGRTLRAWPTRPRPTFETDGVSNGATEASSPIIEKTRRLAH